MINQPLDDYDLGSALHDLANLKTDSETLGRRARALVLGQRHQPSELDQVRADIDRTARVVRALALAVSVSRDTGRDVATFNLEIETRFLVYLRDYERKLTGAKGEPQP